jgi:membrane protease YdiL (CAAX protease family)
MMGLPIVAIGVLMTYGLFLLDQMFQPPPPLFDPETGPAHPIVEQVINAGWTFRIQVLILAGIAAPIVEETMFRGVIYRHLRDGTRTLGAILSFGISAALNSFVFAIIHPQGWVAIPALMSLAIAFTIIREWRGTLIPAMIMHGIQNTLVFTLMLVALGL